MAIESMRTTRKRRTSRGKRGTRAAPKKKVRFAVVGLGHIAQVAVLPAFAHAEKRCELAALVSDDPKKLKVLGKRYEVAELRDYSDYDRLLASGDIDAVYIALPNDQHADYVIRAARAGVHVLCEKPLAINAAQCEAIVEAVERARVHLMVAYRLHFERANMKAVDIVRSGRIGQPRFFHSLFGMQVQDPDNIRLKKARGGGPLLDLGIYCLNAARYLFRAEPIEVMAMEARSDDPRFEEVPEMVSALLRFPDERFANFTCSFGSADVASYRIVGTKGDLELDPAYEYAEPLVHHLTVGSRSKQTEYPKRDQFAPELLHFADCILDDRTPEPDALEGLADARVLDAIVRSAQKSKSIQLDPLDRRRRPTLALERFSPPVDKPDTVHVQAAHGD